LRGKLEYKVLAATYFIITFILIGMAIVALVQGFLSQIAGLMMPALGFYAAAPILVMGSYLTFSKGYYKLRVLSMARA